MGATQNGNEMSLIPTKKSSCKSSVNEGFPANDAMPPKRQRSCSRSYRCNRFFSYSTNALMLAVCLLLGLLVTAEEANGTTSILVNQQTEDYKAASRLDVDNEISVTPNENPTKVDKDDYIPPSLTENLEDTIRNSVKNEIEKEQIAVSPALKNAYNVLPENEKILLVGYTGTTGTDLMNELPVEPSSEGISNIKCDASSFDCLRPNTEEVPSSTPVSINEKIAPTTVSTNQEIISTTLVIPTTIISEATLEETSTQIPRESRTFESGNAVEQSSNSEVGHASQTVLDNVPESPTNSSNNLNSTIILDESQTQNDPISELIAGSLRDIANENTELVPVKSSVPIEQLLDTKEIQAHVTEEEKTTNTSIESERSSVVTSQTEVDNSLDIANETIVHFPEWEELETKAGVEDPVVEPRNNDKLATEIVNVDPKEVPSKTQQASIPIDETAGPAIIKSDINRTEVEPSNEQTESTTLTVKMENDIAQSIDSSTDVQAIANETMQPEILENHLNAIQEENLGTTPSSELPLLASENETLSITFEELLTATEPPLIAHVDDFVKTVINMEDPVLEEVLAELTTLKPEQSIHNVIKKQGVEPIDIEIPSNTAEEEVESATLLPRISIPIGAVSTEEESVQAVKIDSNETEVAAQPERVVPPVSDEKQSTDTPMETKAQDITELSVVFPGKGDNEASLSSKGSRSINSLHSPLAGQHKASINFDVYPAGQTFNANLAEELPNDIGKSLPTQSMSLTASNRSTIIIAVCSGTALLFIVISVTLFVVTFQRQHGTLDIEMQERRDNVNDLEAETCLKLLDIELPSTSLANQTDAEAEIEECL